LTIAYRALNPELLEKYKLDTRRRLNKQSGNYVKYKQELEQRLKAKSDEIQLWKKHLAAQVFLETPAGWIQSSIPGVLIREQPLPMVYHKTKTSGGIVVVPVLRVSLVGDRVPSRGPIPIKHEYGFWHATTAQHGRLLPGRSRFIHADPDDHHKDHEYRIKDRVATGDAKPGEPLIRFKSPHDRKKVFFMNPIISKGVKSLMDQLERLGFKTEFKHKKDQRRLKRDQRWADQCRKEDHLDNAGGC